MRQKILSISILVLMSFIFTNCSSDDDSQGEIQEYGPVQIKFENRFEGLSPIALNQTIQTSSNGQVHQFSALKYIVSNFTLTNEQGVSYNFHLNDPDQGAFVIDQNDAVINEIKIDLDSIPAGTYTKVKFGLGISPDAYLLGGESQAEFWTQATDEGMSWSWATGYIFVKLEGSYGSDVPNINFSNHSGNMGDISENGTPNLYREIELDLPAPIQVSSQEYPGIHFIADLNQFLSGETDLVLDESNHEAMGSSPYLVNVTNNLSKMFSVSHIHQ